MGTRISQLYPALPKALIPVGGRPFIAWLIDWLRSGGIESVHLAAGHLAEDLLVLVNQLSERGERITIAREERPLGTAGALKFSEAYITEKPFAVLNGDTMLPQLDLLALQRSHQESDALVTIAVTRMEQAGRYGTVVFDERRRITAFREKQDTAAGWVNGGLYVMEAGVLDHIEPDVETSLEVEVFPELASKGRVYAHLSDPPLLDMGTPKGLQITESYLREHVIGKDLDGSLTFGIQPAWPEHGKDQEGRE
jgi:NDP-sugar pyrophosphorylase family protein